MAMRENTAVGDNLLIVDALNLAFRYKHRGTKLFTQDYIKTVLSLAKSYDASNIIMTSDWGKSSWRLAKYPEYKGDREAKYIDQTAEEKKEFTLFIEEFNRALDAMEAHATVLRYKGVEADDLAAYITTHCLDRFDGDVWLISSDKDWDLLINSRVSRFSHITRAEYMENNWDDMHVFPHKHALGVKVLVGGKDNIEGVKGIGEKRAAQLLVKYDNLLDLYEAMPIPGKSQYINNLNAFDMKIFRNIELIDKAEHCIEAIGKENVEDIESKLCF